MRSLDPRLPVLIGLGAAAASASVVDLMTDAVVAAAADAGAPALLDRIDCIAVPQGSWSLTDPGRTVARRVGSPDARTLLCEIGVSQQEVINHALAAVAAGRAETFVVAGAEARAWARDGGIDVDEEAEPPDDMLTRPPDFIAAVEIAAGMAWPVAQQYALIENALAAAAQLPPDRQRDEIAGLWARYNAVAAHNRWHASQWTVNQASALLICSAERAQAAGVPAERWLFPHVALHSSAAVTLTARRHLEEWPAMGVLGRAAALHVGRPLEELPLAEVYSCFPAAVRVQQRELGLDPAGTPTLTGGMAFSGGPFNHFVLQSLRVLGGHLRSDPSALGLLTTVSGMLSKPGLAIWSATPPSRGGAALLADMATETTAATSVVPVVDSPPRDATTATVASFTVTYGGDEGFDPVRTAIVADLPDGVRTAATCEDSDTARLAVTDGLIGRAVSVKDTTFSL